MAHMAGRPSGRAMFSLRVLAAACAPAAGLVRPASTRHQPRIELSGSWEVVYNYTTDACGDLNPFGHRADFSDSVPVAWYDRAAGEVTLMSATPFNQHVFTGPGLDQVRHICKKRVFASFNSTDPRSYANHQWIQSLKWDGDNLYALVHNEFHGEMLNDSHFCSWNTSRNGTTVGPTKYHGQCQLWSMGVAIRSKGGEFRVLAKPPEHLAAAPPSMYEKDQAGPVGFGAISSVLRGKDGMLYGLVHVESKSEGQETGNCAFMLPDLAEPASFRAWNGSDFSVAFPNPYQDHGSPKDPRPACEPIAHDSGEMDGSLHPVARRLVGFPSGWPNFMLIGLTEGGAHARGLHNGNVTYSFSWEADFRDAVTSWSQPAVVDLGLSDLPFFHKHMQVLYPTVLDTSSPSMSGAGMEGDNFELVGNRTAWLYLVLDRMHIVRRRMHFFDSRGGSQQTDIHI